MDQQARKILFDIARKSVVAAIKKQPAPDFRCDHSDLQQLQGAFVTLKVHGHLRGCIGRFTSDIPLHQLVSQMAASSATEDFRFEHNRITLSELKDMEIEISVLSAPKPINNPLDFELGKHGILIKNGFRIGCFLPQVATETRWSKEEFLSHCCSSKANLPPDAWKYGDVEICIFTAEIIKEKDIV